MGVRRDKAAFSSGCDVTARHTERDKLEEESRRYRDIASPTRRFAPAESNRSRYGVGSFASSAVYGRLPPLEPDLTLDDTIELGKRLAIAAADDGDRRVLRLFRCISA
jgi:hypothetical protein